jgi:lysophospholipase L1-like esterase
VAACTRNLEAYQGDKPETSKSKTADDSSQLAHCRDLSRRKIRPLDLAVAPKRRYPRSSHLKLRQRSPTTLCGLALRPAHCQCQCCETYSRKAFLMIRRFTTMASALILFCGLATRPTASRAETSVPIADGDRIVLLGDAFIERMQANGFFEVALQSRLARKNVTIRNLGWSGDTVQGIARAVFGSPEDGYKRLLKDTQDAKPTLIILAYGANEAHQSKAGLDTFNRQFNRLLDDLEKTGARIAILEPTPHVTVNSLRPSPDLYNGKLQLYLDAIRKTAAERGYPVINVAAMVKSDWKENGIHFSEYGYWQLANALADHFAAPEISWDIRIDLKDKSYEAVNVELSNFKFGGEDGVLSFSSRARQLPRPKPPRFSPIGTKTRIAKVTIGNLPPGRYRLRIGDSNLGVASAEQWSQGVEVRRPDAIAVAEMQSLIVKKNELYFHRYRPQNETYLFLFRKHEQGNNAVEIPQFVPLIKQLEEQIQTLRLRQRHRLSLQVVGG